MSDRDQDSLHPFFRNVMSHYSTTPRQAPRSQDRGIRQVRPEPTESLWPDLFSGEVPGPSSSIPSFRRSYQPPRRQSVARKRPRGLLDFAPMFSLGPPSPQTESEEDTPTPSPRTSPVPPRSPSPKLKEYNPIARPNTPITGVPENSSRRAEDNINMGFGFAYSWMDTLKVRRRESEERIALPTIFRTKHRKTLIMLVAHKNVDETVFHKVEVEWKSQKRILKALRDHFHLRHPHHRLRYSVSDVAEVPLTQAMIDRFDAVEYFRLCTKKRNKWVLYHVVNSSKQYMWHTS